MATNAWDTPWDAYKGQQGSLGTMGNWDTASAGQRQAMQSPLYNGYGGKDASYYDPSANAAISANNAMPTLQSGQYYDAQGKAQSLQQVGGQTVDANGRSVFGQMFPGGMWANPGSGTGGMGAGAGTVGTTSMTSPGIDWMSTDKQNSLRQVMGNQGQTAQNMSSAMREWGVSNSALMNAMGWNQQQFDDYFKPVFGNQSPQGMGGGTTGMTKPMQLPGGNSYAGGNPYLSQMADEIGRRSNEGLQRSLQGIRSNAVGVGGLGGSRQGVAESGAIGASQDSLQGQLANLFGGQYNQDANRSLQRYGMDQSDSTQRYGMDQNYDINSQRTRNDFYTSQRGQDLTQFGIGVDAYGKGMEGPWGPVKNASSVYATYAKNAQDAGANKSNWQTVLGTGIQALTFAKDMGWL